MEIRPSKKPAETTQASQDQSTEAAKQKSAARSKDSYEEAKASRQDGQTAANKAPEPDNKPDDISNALLKKQVITARFEAPAKKSFSPGSGKTPPQESEEVRDMRARTRIGGTIGQGETANTILFGNSHLLSIPKEVEDRLNQQTGRIHPEIGINDQLQSRTDQQNKLDQAFEDSNVPRYVPDKTPGSKTPPAETESNIPLAERGSGKTPPVETAETDTEGSGRDVGQFLSTAPKDPVSSGPRIDLGGSPIADSLTPPSQDSSWNVAVERKDVHVDADAIKPMEWQNRLKSGDQNTDDDNKRTPGQKRKQ